MTPQDKQAFEELLANCADEPIRFPGAIQPHGLLLTLSEPALQIIQISANVETLLGRAPEPLIGQPLHELIGLERCAQVLEALQRDAQADAPPLYFRLNGTAFEGLLHRHQGVLILELEIHVENFQPRNVAGVKTHLGRMLQRLQAATSLQALYDISVKEIQAMTGYDRVLIYRFEEEGHGQVIAEASDPSMEVFNGLFFPASDIPEQARELYRTNWLRIIPNADYQPVPLVPKLRPDTRQPLDLSFATLRSVSPIHCQYMKNMGVLSSMSISLLKGDKLWGLISCGNRQPLHVPHELRMACQTIGQVLSLQISAMEAPMIMIGKEFGLSQIFGAVIAAGFITIALAPVFSRLLRFFPPVVIGSLITIIGISLMPAAAIWLGGGNPDAADFGNPANLLLGLATVSVTLVIYAKFKGFIGNLSVLIGLFVGSLIAAACGMTHFSRVSEAAWFELSAPMAFGAPVFAPVPILIMTLAMLVIMAETTGNCLAIGKLTGKPTTQQTLGNAFRADGLSTMLGGFFNSFPYNAFTQNTGLIALSNVKSRFVVAAAGAIMVLMGLFPKLGALIAAVPTPVLGGCAIVMFGMTTVAGIQELSRVQFEGTRNGIIVAVSVSVGVLPMSFPALFEHVGPTLKLVLDSGIFLGAITAIVLNVLLNNEKKSTETIGATSAELAD